MAAHRKHVNAHTRTFFSNRIRRLVFLFCVLLFAVAWQREWVGRLARQQINYWLLPRELVSGRVLLQPLTVVLAGEAVPLVEGVELTVSPAWSRSVLQASPWPSFLMPPGLLTDGLVSAGSVAFPQPDDTVFQVPFYLRARAEVGMVPHLHIRFPATSLNYLLDAAFAEDWTETGEYLLGSYDLEQRIRFDLLRITTVTTDVTRPMFPIMLEGVASGELRYRFRDGWFRATVTARVRELRVSFVLIPIAHPDGIGFDYRARVEKLDLRVRKMPRWVERRLARSVRASMERSLNHRRKRERMARNRWPLWLPMALSVDAEIINPPEPVLLR
ncbi:MAG: hypothetical protein ACNA71_02580 [Kiritimatiellia bacterium]